MALPGVEKTRGIRPNETVPCVWDDVNEVWVPVAGNADGSMNVTIVNAETPVELTGDLVVDTLGALTDDAEVDPDAVSATIPSILRGSLTQQLAILAKLDDPATETTLATLGTEATLADVKTATEALATALADPASETTLAALLAIIGTAGDDHEDATVMGVLTRIAVGVEALAS